MRMNNRTQQYWKSKIPTMTHEEMACLWRFAPPGHPCFVNPSSTWTMFEKRFNKFGGMTPEISKKIGL